MESKKKKNIRRKVRLRTLFFLALTLASNSFAWFIYSTKVSNSITAKVRSWNVDFEVGDSDAEEYVEINIDSLYPGMETFNRTIKASNNGEADAKISYEVVEANILGDNLLGTGKTSEQILNSLKNNYPFSINLTSSNSIVAAGGGVETISFTVTWPYDSGQDAEDTRWGTLAYDYHNANPDKSSISLLIKITAVQIE